ncbi:MAG: TlpA family protein disulfide reductase [Planctomycetota bacterium]|nr:TlpA family protein disulfide reductase [Planctomycetaceae bacterium]MDQ3332026.1 TlpA family protein disulfide reductase [Planctomycetota bacterium]
MATQPRFDRSHALGTALKIVALAAGGLLFLLLVLVVVGGSLFEPPRGMAPDMAGLAVGKTAPALAAEGWINGEPEAYDGKITLVQGWFYDCPFCWQEAPEIADLHAKYGDRVAFVALSPDPPSDIEKVQEFVDKGGLKYPVGYGARDTLVGFEAAAFPVVWLVGSDGTVIWNGAVEGEQSLEQAIKAALSPRRA